LTKRARTLLLKRPKASVEVGERRIDYVHTTAKPKRQRRSRRSDKKEHRVLR